MRNTFLKCDLMFIKKDAKIYLYNTYVFWVIEAILTKNSNKPIFCAKLCAIFSHALKCTLFFFSSFLEEKGAYCKKNNKVNRL